MKTNLSLSKVKTFTGMEGPGFNAYLMVNGDQVAFLIDDASGGPLQVNWANEAAQKRVEEYINQLAPERMPEGAEPWMQTLYTNGFRKQTLEMVIEQLLTMHEVNKQLTRLLKTNILFVKPGQESGAYMKMKRTASHSEEQLKQHILSRHPGARFFTTASELFQTPNDLVPVQDNKPVKSKPNNTNKPSDDLAQMGLGQLYAKAELVGVKDAHNRWSHLNPGMQKMQLIQAIRKASKKS